MLYCKMVYFSNFFRDEKNSFITKWMGKKFYYLLYFNGRIFEFEDRNKVYFIRKIQIFFIQVISPEERKEIFFFIFRQGMTKESSFYEIIAKLLVFAPRKIIDGATSIGTKNFKILMNRKLHLVTRVSQGIILRFFDFLRPPSLLTCPIVIFFFCENASSPLFAMPHPNFLYWKNWKKWYVKKSKSLELMETCCKQSRRVFVSNFNKQMQRGEGGEDEE